MAPTALLGAAGVADIIKAAQDTAGKKVCTIALNEDLDLCPPDSDEAAYRWEVTVSQLVLLFGAGALAYLIWMFRQGKLSWDPFGLSNISLPGANIVQQGRDWLGGLKWP